MSKEHESNWGVKDLYEYAVQQYKLCDRLSLSDTDRSAIERSIRRRLEKNNLVHKHNYTEQKTGKEKEKYVYVVTQKIGQYLIDFLMKDYFTKLIGANYNAMEKIFAEMDDKLNRESIERHEELIEEYNNNSENTPFPEEHMQCRIDRFMLRAIFNLFYDFDEAKYRKDSIEQFQSYDNNSSVNNYIDGYSKVNYRLKNPVENYCMRKNTK